MNSRQFVLRVLLSLAVLLLLSAALPPRMVLANWLHSVTIRVTTTNDEIRANKNCSLREAILAANTNRRVDRCPAGADSDTIQLPAGRYNLKIAGIEENHNRTGDLDLRANIKILGAGASKTIIDGQRVDRVIHIPVTSASVLLSDLTIRNGYIEFSEVEPNDGGGIYNRGRLSLNRVRVTTNTAHSGFLRTDGGGIYNSGTLAAVDTRIDGNYSEATGGALSSIGRVALTRVTIDNNLSYDSGGLVLKANSVTTIRDSRITNNKGGEAWGDSGGNAIVLDEDARLLVERTLIQGNEGNTIRSRGALTFRRVTVQKNGGSPNTMAVMSGTANISDSSFNENGAEDLFLVTGDASVRIERSTFNDGAGSAFRVEGGALTLLNSTITAMKGAQTILVTGGSLTLESDTIADNWVEQRGLIVQNGSLVMHNTILANSTLQSTGELTQDCLVTPGTAVSLGYNLLGNVDGCNWPIQPTDQHAVNNAHIDPRLGPLAKNGGYTRTRALLTGSPAIDQGDPQVFLPTDQRRVPRPQGPRSDIGAFEVKAP